MRPINSCIGSPTYSVAKYLAKILKPLECRSTNTVNNSKEFSDFVSTQVIEHDETVVSFDVVSLFTSIPLFNTIVHTNPISYIMHVIACHFYIHLYTVAK